VQTRAATVADVLLEHNIVRSPEDALDVRPEAAIAGGETIHYRAAVPVTLTIDGVQQTLRSAAPTVRDLLAERGVAYDAHDRLSPEPNAELAPDATVRIDHVESWTETVAKPVPAPVKRVASFNLSLGTSKVLDRGAPGVREVAYLITRAEDRSAAPKRTVFATRLLRKPQPKIVAEGIGEFAGLASIARRGFDGTVNLATSAITMVATAYTAGCYGCSGVTKLGMKAGHGIVAVDPSVIPLGSHLYIPGYGHAIAGDTGGAIRGNRIDLGMESVADAFRFGRRNLTVYVLHK
jgi:3D (Asp-Asp-Asp) domain-containing protein